MLHNQHPSYLLTVLRYPILMFGHAELQEVPFDDAGDADAAEQTYLTQECGTIIGNGTSRGACSCGPAK